MVPSLFRKEMNWWDEDWRVMIFESQSWVLSSKMWVSRFSSSCGMNWWDDCLRDDDWWLLSARLVATPSSKKFKWKSVQKCWVSRIDKTHEGIRRFVANKFKMYTTCVITNDPHAVNLYQSNYHVCVVVFYPHGVVVGWLVIWNAVVYMVTAEEAVVS